MFPGPSSAFRVRELKLGGVQVMLFAKVGQEFTVAVCQVMVGVFANDSRFSSMAILSNLSIKIAD